MHCCVFYLCCPQTPTGESVGITGGGGGAHSTNLSTCGFNHLNVMTLLCIQTHREEENHENKEFEDNTKLDGVKAEQK